VRDGFHLFVYGTLRREGAASKLLAGCEYVGPATVGGTLYDIGGRFPALLLYGKEPVRGEIWLCPFERLAQLDAYEGVERGLFRRAGLEVDGIPCWTYVAGPAVARELTPDRCIPAGDWLLHTAGDGAARGSGAGANDHPAAR
jgi:gamma-glutamylcyclotransferase (GGCT)/AIG2-like uncharacterized protein YtfP